MCKFIIKSFKSKDDDNGHCNTDFLNGCRETCGHVRSSTSFNVTYKTSKFYVISFN